MRFKIVIVVAMLLLATSLTAEPTLQEQLFEIMSELRMGLSEVRQGHSEQKEGLAEVKQGLADSKAAWSDSKSSFVDYQVATDNTFIFLEARITTLERQAGWNSLAAWGAAALAILNVIITATYVVSR